MQRLNILHVVNSFDPAGDVVRCVAELRKYSRHAHELIVKIPHPKQKIYAYPEPALLGDRITLELIAHLFDWADAVLYQFVGWERGWHDLRKPMAFRNINIYFDVAANRFFSTPNYNAGSLEEYKLLASSHAGAADFLPGCRFLPDLIPIYDALYTADFSPRPPCLSYIKHSEDLDEIDWSEGTKRLNLHETWHPLILWKRKTQATVVIDNVCDGHYGLAGCETLSLGLPTIVFNHPKTKAALEEMAPEYPPFIEVGPSVYRAVDEARTILAMSADELLELRQKIRTWTEIYYNSARLIEMFWDPFLSEIVT